MINFETSGFESFRLSIVSNISKYQVSGLLHLLPHIHSRSTVEVESGLWKSTNLTIYSLNPPKYLVSGIQYLLPRVPRSIVRIYSALQSFGSLQTLTILDQVQLLCAIHQGPHRPHSREVPRGRILEVDTWPNQAGYMCHVLTGIINL